MIYQSGGKSAVTDNKDAIEDERYGKHVMQCVVVS